MPTPRTCGGLSILAALQDAANQLQDQTLISQAQQLIADAQDPTYLAQLPSRNLLSFSNPVDQGGLAAREEDLANQIAAKGYGVNPLDVEIPDGSCPKISGSASTTAVLNDIAAGDISSAAGDIPAAVGDTVSSAVSSAVSGVFSGAKWLLIAVAAVAGYLILKEVKK